MNRGLYSVISGLNAARTGLAVTGHNMSNVDTVGYTRQQALQNDFTYQGIGGRLQVGLGTDVTMIRQIRDTYLDKTYRGEVGRATYHNTIYATGNEVENIYGELESLYSTQSITQDMWDAINELVMHPSGVATRNNFLATANSYITKMNNTYTRLVNEQLNLNVEVKNTVSKINSLTERINELNSIIPLAEASGQRANDYRDERNLCLDELSALIKIEYHENYRGEVVVTTGGKELVANGMTQKIGLRYCGPNSSLVEPVFTYRDEILDFDPTYQNATSVFNYNQTPGAATGNDTGTLYALIVSRGLYPTSYDALSGAYSDEATQLFNDFFAGLNGTYTAFTGSAPDPADYADGVIDKAYIADYQSYLGDLDTYLAALETEINTGGNTADITAYNDFMAEYADEKKDFENFLNSYNRILFNATECVIPSTLREMDLLFNYVVTLINDTLSQGYDLNGAQSGTLVFSETVAGDGYKMGNVKLNEDLLNSDGYKLLCLSSDPTSRDDPTYINELMAKWKEAGAIFENIDGAAHMNIEDAYRYIIDNIAAITSESKSFFESQADLVNELDNKRLLMSAVSLDEEMSNMMVYQHAFNAASRIVSVIDSMLDKLINGTGRVGI